MRSLLVNVLLADALFAAALATAAPTHSVVSFVFGTLAFVAWLEALYISEAL